LISALIHPDGRLTILRGELTTDAASVAALAHAVHAAGNELAIRIGKNPVQSVTLNGVKNSLTLLPVAEGVLLQEHELSATLEGLQKMVADLLSRQAPTPPPAAPAVSISLSDALHATAP